MFDLNWYNSLNHPPLTPPYWVFAPVWTILYILIFISFVIYLIKSSSQDKSWGSLLYFSQLVVNLCWAPVFFYFHNIGLALAMLIALCVLVIWNIIVFYKVSKQAGCLLIPYFLWLLYALYLNAGVFILN